MKSIIFVIVLSSLFSLNNGQAQQRDPSIARVCSQTKFIMDCVNSLSLYTSGAVDGYSALRAGLRDLGDQARTGFWDAKKMSKPDEIVVARFQILRDSCNKAVEALNARDYDTVRKELDVELAAVNHYDSTQQEYLSLTELCKLLNKVATNNLQILMKAVKPSSLPNLKV